MNRRFDQDTPTAAAAAAAATALDKLLATSDKPVRDAFDDVTAFIRSVVPDAHEKVNPGWRSLNFSHPRVGYFCGIFPFEDHLRIVFEFGVLLPDPDGVFDSRQKQIASITIRSRRDIRRRSLRRLLLDAVALPADRATRLSLAAAGAKPKER